MLGHALRQALGMIARQQGRELTAVASAAGAALVAGSSVKAALALDWDDPSAQQQALTRGLDAFHAMEHWLTSQAPRTPAGPCVSASLAAAQ